MNVLTVLEISPSEMLEFCLDIESLYQDVPYHSFNHAIDVVVKLYYVLYDLHTAAYLASYDIAALLIAGLCHDSGHPGLNNLFQKNANTDLAKRYPDAILERYSMDLAEEYIIKHQLFRNVENLRDPMYSDSTATEVDVASRMMYSIRTAILHTDMSRHFDVVEECKVLVSLLSKKARRMSEHEAYNKDCATDTASGQTHVTSAPVSGSTTPLGAAPPKMDHLAVNRHSFRGRSPSEPVAPTKSLFAYSMLSTNNTASQVNTITPKPSMESVADSAHSPHSHSDLSSRPGADGIGLGGAKGHKIRRMQVRRSVSMRDALLDSMQRQTLINTLLHAVDVFNPVLPWSMCKKWSDLMNAESFDQGDLEKKLGLPVSPNMDRETTDQRQVSLDFGNIIIRPFFVELVPIFPVADGLLSALEANMQKWSRLSSDTTHEISPPLGANSHVYSWPIEPVENPVLRASSGPLFADRRLSIAAGTVDIPYTRLEMIRRHSHEGFEALHRRMVGRLFSKHLEKIQERRKVSYTASQNPQPLFDRQQQALLQPIGSGCSEALQRREGMRSGPLTLMPGTIRQWKGFDSDMLSPVTEASCIDDSSAPTSATNLEFDSDVHNSDWHSGDEPLVREAAALYHHHPPSVITTNVDDKCSNSNRVPRVMVDPQSTLIRSGRPCSDCISSDPYAITCSDGCASPNSQLSNYRIDSLSSLSRLQRSLSLDPTMLSSLPTSYPSLRAADTQNNGSPVTSVNNYDK
ncbi:hypothetical protein GGI07_005332 [Coemansia sp. Benny D115]|nr:hypothetical protein GGI07_005332 [Coemansia sp. Benny D115]